MGEAVETLEVLVRWGDYRRIEAEDGDPDRDAATPGAETEAGRDRQRTTGESGLIRREKCTRRGACP